MLIEKVFYIPLPKNIVWETESFRYRDNAFLSVNHEYLYERFFADFGPLHLGHIATFCKDLKAMASNSARVYILSCDDEHSKSNCAVLIGAYLVRNLS